MDKRFNRRRPEAYRLRCYMDGLRQAESTTDEQWLMTWVRVWESGRDTEFVMRDVFIAYLKQCIFEELNQVLKEEAA